MNKLSILSWMLCISSTIAFTSCTKDENTKQETENYKGVLVVNEGGFGKSNGSLGLYKPGDKTYFDAFKKANDRPLGDVVQSVNQNGDYLYVIVNNSNKIEVLKKSDFKSIATISTVSPRYMVSIASNKAYVSNLNSNSIKIFNTSSQTIVSEIAINHNSDQMAMMGNKVYVSTFDNKIMVVNSAIDSLRDSIVTPNGLSRVVSGSAGKLGVLCTGLVDFNTGNVLEVGKVLIINDSNKIEKTIPLATGSYGGSMIYSPFTDLFYFSLGDNVIYQVGLSGTVTIFKTLDIGRAVYGLTYNSSTNEIYVTDAGDFNSAGKVIAYDLNGNKTLEFNAGIAPNGVFFNN